MLAIVHRSRWDVSHITCKGMLSEHFVAKLPPVYLFPDFITIVQSGLKQVC